MEYCANCTRHLYAGSCSFCGQFESAPAPTPTPAPARGQPCPTCNDAGCNMCLDPLPVARLVREVPKTIEVPEDVLGDAQALTDWFTYYVVSPMMLAVFVFGMVYFGGMGVMVVADPIASQVGSSWSYVIKGTLVAVAACFTASMLNGFRGFWLRWRVAARLRRR